MRASVAVADGDVGLLGLSLLGMVRTEPGCDAVFTVEFAEAEAG